ncbi:MAG: EAL domain-containing protein [Gammaproteobacteria bacterium]|nr:EAL domain-containing protein [Gammaproteobacteria bacterium]
MTTRTPQARSRPFFSLKWKAIILSVIIAFIIAGSLSALNYLNLSHQYQEQHEKVYQQYAVHAEGLIDRSAQRLLQIGGIIPSLSGMDAALLSRDARRVTGSLNQHWPGLQINVGINLLRIYSKSNQLLGSWGDGTLRSATIPSPILGWVWKVNENETPTSTLDCSQDCIQYAIVPLLANGQNVGAVLLGRSLAEVILDFKKVSGTDIGVAVQDDSVQNHNGNVNAVKVGNSTYRIVAITSPKKSQQILARATLNTPLGTDSGQELQIPVNDRIYETKALPLRGVVNSKTLLVVITDVTDDIAHINADIKESLITAAAGLAISVLLLLAFLWSPMSRLKKTASSLPLLSNREFDRARSILAMNRDTNHLDDEVDILNDTAISLSHQLEALEKAGSDYTLDLARRADEISRQKDFVTNLLDTAQAIIITQNSRGEITMINQYGEALLGYQSDELLGSPFANHISQTDITSDAFKDIFDLVAGRRSHLNHELNMLCKDGTLRYIAWYHSRPPQHENEGSEVLSVGIDITDRKIAESKLSWLAQHDSLTSLANRRQLQTILGRLINLAVRDQQSGALLYLDIDQFKDVNDSSGHHAGDALLKNIAERLGSTLQNDEVIARLGGDEFAIVVPRATREQAIETAKQIEAQLKNIALPASGRIHRISASIGIALFPQHGESVYDLLANADIAMYQAKGGGRGRWHLFSDDNNIREQLQQRIYWKDRLEQALIEDRFVLHYQPIVDISSGLTTHFEALIRLKNDDDSLTLPGAFIQIAESAGMIHRIDRLVVSKAIDQIEQLHADSLHPIFSINLSAHAFNDPDLFELIKERVRHGRFDASKLIFEVTETAAVSDFAAARDYMQAIRELGCRFSLDDFGVGFSSFYSLKQLPVDYIKIDGSFIRNLHENPDDQILVQALAQVARSFGKKTVAEFVDNDQALRLLSRYQIDYAQGFFLGRPQPPHEAFAILSRQQQAAQQRG